jgi:hypothetical protein
MVKITRPAFLSLTSVFLFLFALPAFGENPVEALPESAAMRRCPVESSKPIPSAILQAVKSRADVEAKNTYTVPLHIHVLQDSQGTNPTSTAIIDAMVARLNSGFSRTGFVFQIQSIETVVNDSWAQIPKNNRSVLDDISAALNVGSRDSANVYIHLLEGLCGVASLPYAEDQYEAVYLDYRCIPGGEESDAYDTVIHEMGHFLGLFHTFAPEPNGCRGKGDYISDTPFQKTAHFQCKRYDTCPKKPGLDPVRNYMDYTGDSCGHRFTRGQIALMRNAHAYYRLS